MSMLAEKQVTRVWLPVVGDAPGSGGDTNGVLKLKSGGAAFCSPHDPIIVTVSTI